jgi:hypothetical protein
MDLGKGFVIFLDALGTKDAEPERFLHKWQLFDNLINEQFHYDAHNVSPFRKIAFSDTVIINAMFTSEISPLEILERMCDILSSIVRLGLDNDILLRGCIAYGEYYRSNSKSIVVGQPVNEAHNYHDMIEWMGISAAPSFYNFLYKLSSGTTSEILTFAKLPFLPYDIPLKGRTDPKGFALNWLYAKNTRTRLEYREKILAKMEGNLPIDVAFKLRNTLHIIDYAINKRFEGGSWMRK